jgi:tetratricopeptide (TPR) repeat protein
VSRASDRTEVISSCVPAVTAAVDAGSSVLRPSVLTASWVLADQIVDGWRKGQPPDTRAALSEFPHLELDKQIVLELAYEEYCLSESAGKAIDLDAFCDRFPDQRAALFRLLKEHQGAIRRFRDKKLVPPRWPKPGEKLEHYGVVDFLGRGTFAVVYLTFDENTQRLTVVKASVRGEAEAKLLGPLEHDAVVPIWSATTTKANVSLVTMPFIGRATLHHLIDDRAHTSAPAASIAEVLGRIHSQPTWQPRVPEGSLFVPEVKRAWIEGSAFVALHLARGLEYLHGKQVRHGDLKPSNILLRWDGRPVILDFNLSESTIDSPRFGGTVPYMAPELIQATLTRGKDCTKVDGKADVFSLGVICFELMTGEHPFGPLPKKYFRGKSARQEASRWLLARQRLGFRQLRDFEPAIDPALARLIEQCLHWDPNQRPSAEQLAAGLQQLRGGPHRVRRWVRLHPLGTGLAASLALAVVLTTGIGLAQRPPAEVRAMQHGNRALAAGRPSEAEADFTRVLKLQPENSQAFFGRGAARLRQNDMDGAMHDFNRASEIHEDGPTLACLAYCLMRSQYHREAIAKADRAERLGYRSAALFNNRGISHWRNRLLGTEDLQVARQKLELARLDFYEAIRIDPNQPAPYYNRAMIQFFLWGKMKEPSYLVDAQQDILAALERGSLRGEIAKNAADILAESKFTDQDRIIDLLHQAVADGLDPARLAKDSNLLHLPKQDSRFQQLLLEKAGERKAGAPGDLIDPSR